MSMSAGDGKLPEIPSLTCYTRVEPEIVDPSIYASAHYSMERPQTFMLGPQFCGVNLSP
jgi:hypothetical protein